MQDLKLRPLRPEGRKRAISAVPIPESIRYQYLIYDLSIDSVYPRQHQAEYTKPRNNHQ